MSKVGLQISAIDPGINASTVKAIRLATSKYIIYSTLVPYIPRIRILGDGHQEVYSNLNYQGYNLTVLI